MGKEIFIEIALTRCQHWYHYNFPFFTRANITFWADVCSLFSIFKVHPDLMESGDRRDSRWTFPLERLRKVQRWPHGKWIEARSYKEMLENSVFLLHLLLSFLIGWKYSSKKFSMAQNYGENFLFSIGAKGKKSWRPNCTFAERDN